MSACADGSVAARCRVDARSPRRCSSRDVTDQSAQADFEISKRRIHSLLSLFRTHSDGAPHPPLPDPPPTRTALRAWAEDEKHADSAPHPVRPTCAFRILPSPAIEIAASKT